MASAAVRKAGTADRRSEPRVALGQPGVVRFADDRSIAVTVVDLNREGCRVLTDQPIARGAEILLGLANVGLTPARIVWHGPDGYGCAFERLLPPGAVTAVFSGSNVAYLPGAAGAGAGAHAAAPLRKLDARTRAIVVLGASALGWGLAALAIAAAF